MNNKYLEQLLKIASFKGFRANRLALRDLATGEGGLSRDRYASTLRHLRDVARRDGKVEMEPDFVSGGKAIYDEAAKVQIPLNHPNYDAMASQKGVDAEARIREKYPKGMSSMFRIGPSMEPYV
jgi:hypothetical protein